jgi:tRNA(Ile)-lysidine synthase
MNPAWSDFEHRFWKCLKENNLEDKDQFLLAVSGGLDSIVLLDVLSRVKPRAQIKVAYFHHGPSSDQEQQNFRDEAAELVKRQVGVMAKSNITFVMSKSAVVLTSEEQMRKGRYTFLKSLKSNEDILVTGHHLDDRAETILLKMIRGTPLAGVISFKVWNQEIFRPFLNETKVEILKYANENKLRWVEDPSNKDEVYLRNWLRENWLKNLEEKCPGGRANLAKSLFRIIDQSTDLETLKLELTEEDAQLGLSRQWYVSLSKADQLRGLALFLKKHHITNFTSGQLEEIRKRLDKNQKDITFELLGRKWVINATQIVLQ